MIEGGRHRYELKNQHVIDNEPRTGFFGNHFEKALDDLAEKLRAQGIRPEQAAEKIAQVLPKRIAEAGALILESLKAHAEEMLVDRRQIRGEFEQRQREKWDKAFDCLTMLLEAAREAGEEYHRACQAAAAEQDFIYDALVRLHARARLVTHEILWLMQSGFERTYGDVVLAQVE
jgi:hypothetical protein